MNYLDRRILAGRIKDLRKALGETQQQFAERIGVGAVNVSNYEVATQRPSYRVTAALYQAAFDAKQIDLADYFKDRMTGMFEAGYGEKTRWR
jgi:transcriptional regulator with XRE-family HTH domain